jgi:hypothetical protein
MRHDVTVLNLKRRIDTVDNFLARCAKRIPGVPVSNRILLICLNV